MLAGPKALYVGGTFKNILPKSALDGGKGIPHPGFAMFPAEMRPTTGSDEAGDLPEEGVFPFGYIGLPLPYLRLCRTE